MKELPEKFGGAEVVRGAAMDASDVEDLVDREALDIFNNASRDIWLVLDDDALCDLNNMVAVKGFVDKVTAVRYAQALANGNRDQRVLRVTEQVLVVATMNEL